MRHTCSRDVRSVSSVRSIPLQAYPSPARFRRGGRGPSVDLGGDLGATSGSMGSPAATRALIPEGGNGQRLDREERDTLGMVESRQDGVEPRAVDARPRRDALPGELEHPGRLLPRQERSERRSRHPAARHLFHGPRRRGAGLPPASCRRRPSRAAVGRWLAGQRAPAAQRHRVAPDHGAGRSRAEVGVDSLPPEFVEPSTAGLGDSANRRADVLPLREAREHFRAAPICTRS